MCSFFFCRTSASASTRETSLGQFHFLPKGFTGGELYRALWEFYGSLPRSHCSQLQTHSEDSFKQWGETPQNSRVMFEPKKNYVESNKCKMKKLPPLSSPFGALQLASTIPAASLIFASILANSYQHSGKSFPEK